MTTIVYYPVTIQTSAQSVPSIPDWFGEITLMAHHLQQQGVLAAIEEQVRFARRRFGRYEVIDFVAVLFGYAVSGEGRWKSLWHRGRGQSRMVIGRLNTAAERGCVQRPEKPIDAWTLLWPGKPLQAEHWS